MNYEKSHNGSNGLVLTASLDQLVFDGKNKSYGGYQMRQSDDRRLMMSFYITGIVFLVAVLFFYFRMQLPEAAKQDFVPSMVDDPFKDVVTVELPPIQEDKPDEQPKQPDAPPSPPQPPVQEVLPTQEFKTPNPSPDADTATITEQSELKDNPGLKDDKGGGTPTIGPEPKGPGTPGGTGTGPSGPVEIDITDPDYWKTEQPVALNLDAIRSKIRYPEPLKEAGLEGEVQFKVLVDEEGNYLRHEVRKCAHKLFQSEVEPKIKDLKFKPGRQGSKNVRVWVIVPFKFKLNR